MKLSFISLIMSVSLLASAAEAASGQASGVVEQSEADVLVEGMLLSLGYGPCAIAYMGEGLFLSSAPAARDTSLLETLGITHVLNLTGFKRGSTSELRFPPVTEKGIDFTELVAYLQLPIADENDLTYKEFGKGLMRPSLKFINSAFESNPKARVIVHCEAGISRSSSMVMAYLMRHKQMDLKAAYEQALEKKSNIGPNNRFFEHLIEYEQRLSTRGILGQKLKEAPSITLSAYLAPQINQNYFGGQKDLAEIEAVLAAHGNNPQAAVQQLFADM